VREGDERGEGAPRFGGVAREASDSKQPLNRQWRPTEDGGDLWQGCPERVWSEARLCRILINVDLKKDATRRCICSTDLPNARKEFHAIDRADAVGGNKGSTHLIALERTNQVPTHLNSWAQLRNRSTLLLELLDAIFTERALPSIDRLSDAISGDALSDGEQFNTPRWAGAALFGCANAGVK
jgi:hypothetical protein